MLFKYITCVGSRMTQPLILIGQSCLNTSHVSVQVRNDYYDLGLVFSLNTSHVSVQVFR